MPKHRHDSWSYTFYFGPRSADALAYFDRKAAEHNTTRAKLMNEIVRAMLDKKMIDEILQPARKVRTLPPPQAATNLFDSTRVAHEQDVHANRADLPEVKRNTGYPPPQPRAGMTRYNISTYDHNSSIGRPRKEKSKNELRDELREALENTIKL